MDNLNRQLMDGLYKLLTAKPVDFILQHSLLIGFITGIISLMPFAIKRIPHAVISILAILTAFFISNSLDLSFSQALYSAKFYIVVNLIGNYVIGCIFGFAIANLIQRIRGEHDHVANN